MLDKINILYKKDDKIAYKQLLEFEILCSDSNELYKYFDIFLGMLDNEKSFVRVRGFRLICCLSKWDSDKKIDNNINKILNELDDEVSTSVRQCIKSLNILLLYKYGLYDIVVDKLNKLNISKYKESMQSLIKRDINNITK